MLQLLMQVIR